VQDDVKLRNLPYMGFNGEILSWVLEVSFKHGISWGAGYPSVFGERANWRYQFTTRLSPKSEMCYTTWALDGAITRRKFRTEVIIILPPPPHFMVKLVPGLPTNNYKLPCRQDLPLSLHNNSAWNGCWNNVTRHLSLKISSKSQIAHTDLSQYPKSVVVLPSGTNILQKFRTLVLIFARNRKLS
jgi:hypothetical protein